MPQSQSGITYSILNRNGNTGRREEWRSEVNQCFELLLVNFRDWDTFRNDLLGFGSWTGANLSRTLPMLHPANRWMICVQAELVEVVGTPPEDGDMAEFDETNETPRAVVGATFQSVLYDLLTDEEAGATAFGELSRYVTRESSYGLELLEMKGTVLEFTDLADLNQPEATSRSTIGSNPARPYGKTELIYTWRRVPSLTKFQDGGRPDRFPTALWNNITATVGKINSDTFDGIYEPGTLLCGVPKITQMVGPIGNTEFEVKYNFTYHSPADNISPLGGPVNTDSWNVKYRVFQPNFAPAPGMYPVRIRNANGDVPFRSAPFAKLFTNS